MRTLIAVALLLAAPARAAEPTAPHVQALVDVARIWGAVELHHPARWTTGLDWDAALLHALPKARAATTEDELVAAVNDLLAPLHDPVTRVIVRDAPPLPSTMSKGPPFEWPRPGVLLLRLGTKGSLAPAALDKAKAEIARAKSVIFDLRTDDDRLGWTQPDTLMPLYRMILSRPVSVPGRRNVIHDGYRTQGASSSGGYFSGTLASGGYVIEPDKDARARRAVFIVDGRCDIADAGMGMQAIGDAAFVVVGDRVIDDLLQGPQVPFGQHHAVAVRAFDWDGAPPHADVTLPATAGDQAVPAALRLLGAWPRPRPSASSLPLVWRPDRRYETMKAPDVDHRLLALFRFWTIINAFYPYKDLLDEPWADQLPRAIPRFEAAEGADAYAEAVAALGAKINDCHTGVHGSDSALAEGQAPPPLAARMIEGQPVIVKTLAAAEGLRVGDVILTIDGEAAAAHVARVRPYLACSNEASCGLFGLRRALTGKEGSSLALTVRGADGKTRAVAVPRRRAFLPDLRSWRSGDVVRILDGNVGYVDLDRLQTADVDAMFDKLAKTRAIIFDMRGYPNQTAWAIAPRLDVKHATAAASFQRPVVGIDDRYRHAFMQPLPKGDKPLYRGRTVMLVDERTISQAEHTGLFFEAAAGTRFVGSQTAGANGDVTIIALPGGLQVSFTGHDVRHADGRQLQRLGLPVSVRATPTIAGVQAGRDEVLERALGLLHDGK